MAEATDFIEQLKEQEKRTLPAPISASLHGKSHKEQYAALVKEVNEAQQGMEALAFRIFCLNSAIDALAALIHMEDPSSKADYPRKAGFMKVQPSKIKIADEIRSILWSTAPRALSVADLRDELIAAGVDLSKRSNVAATISAVADRLVSQGFAERVKNENGRNAWKSKPKIA
jgi:hypothetical protein